MEKSHSRQPFFVGIVVLLLAVAFVAFLYENFTDLGKIFVEVKKMSWQMLLVFLLISCINFLVFTAKWDVILRTAHAPIRFFSLVWYRSVAYAISYITPTAQVGGEPFRIYFLQHEKVPRKVAVSSVILDKIFEFTVFAFFCIVAIIWIVANGDTFSLRVALPLLSATIVLILFFVLTVKGNGFFTFLFQKLQINRIKALQPWEEKIVETEHLMKTFFNTHTGALLSAAVLSLLGYALIVLEYASLLYFLGVHITFTELLIVSTIPMLGYATPIPGSVGALEFAQWSAFQLAGMDPLLSIPALVALRIRDIIFVCVGMIYASSHGVNILLAQKAMHDVAE